MRFLLAFALMVAMFVLAPAQAKACGKCSKRSHPILSALFPNVFPAQAAPTPAPSPAPGPHFRMDAPPTSIPQPMPSTPAGVPQVFQSAPTSSCPGGNCPQQGTTQFRPFGGIFSGFFR